MKLRHDMLTHGVNVVCTQHHGRRAGLAVAWATQVSTNRVLICVGKQSVTRDLILASKAFGLSVLTREQLELARVFGTQSSRNVDKFEGLACHAGETGSPLLDDCALTLDCTVETVFDLNGSKLIVGHVVAAERVKEDFEPLIYREED
jgi:flavin reductase (DIM6/NTAB) family NADH-FMN oxidoreductase RutF